MSENKSNNCKAFAALASVFPVSELKIVLTLDKIFFVLLAAVSLDTRAIVVYVARVSRSLSE